MNIRFFWHFKVVDCFTLELILLQMSTRKPARINKISVRFTDRELDLIHARAEAIDLNRTAYIQRQALQNRDIELTPQPTIDTGRMLLVKELRIQGNNLNQIAKGINRSNISGQSLGDYRKLLIEINDELKRLCKIWWGVCNPPQVRNPPQLFGLVGHLWGTL